MPCNQHSLIRDKQMEGSEEGWASTLGGTGGRRRFLGPCWKHRMTGRMPERLFHLLVLSTSSMTANRGREVAGTLSKSVFSHSSPHNSGEDLMMLICKMGGSW